MHNRFIIRFYFPSIRICIDAIQIKICVVQIPEKCSKFAKRSFNLDAIQTGGEFECSRRVF